MYAARAALSDLRSRYSLPSESAGTENA
jgi:hypothetical protein